MKVIIRALYQWLWKIYQEIDDDTPFGWCPQCHMRHVLKDDKGRDILSCTEIKQMAEGVKT